VANDGGLAEWLTRAKTAELLDCSEKTVDRLAARGELQRRLRPAPGRRPEPVYHPSDVERLAEGRSRPFVLPPAKAAEQNSLAVAGQDVLRTYEILERLLQPPAPAKVERLWLTVDEASETSGLSRTLLRRAVRGGALRAVRDGRQWKVRAQDLRKFDPR
jgi:excisionase family DNA binding protein